MHPPPTPRTPPRHPLGCRWPFLFTVLALLLALGAGTARPAQAQQLVYEPLNPAFGGSPANYAWLLSSAQAQNETEEDDLRDRFRRDPLEDFQESLQRQIISQLSRDIVERQFGDALDLTQEGRYELGQFTVEITPGLDGISIRIFDVFSGDESTIAIPNF